MSHSPDRFFAALAALVPALLALAACEAQVDHATTPSDEVTSQTGALTGVRASDVPATAGPSESAGADPLVADQGDEPGFPTSFRALGTEPFWALHVSDERLRYSTPEDQEGKSVPFTRDVTAPGEVALRAELDGKPLVLTGRIANCSDGMSDREYPFAVELRVGDELRKGCARPIEP